MPQFDHIYVEKKSFRYPAALEILKRLKGSEVVEIDDYREFFCRPGQSFSVQKRSRKLILAVKKKNFLYPLPGICGNDRQCRSFYCAQVINCIYDCSYCFLQGMYPSANITVFVNTEDFLEEASKTGASSPVNLFVSHETDLAALENILSFASEWVKFASVRPLINLEIRTKHSGTAFLKGIAPAANVIPAWSILPQEVISLYERLTPCLDERLSAVLDAIGTGWKVRLCFDPLMIISGWQDVYRRFIRSVMSRLPAGGLLDIETGVFRMGKTCFKRLKRTNSSSKVVNCPLYITKGDIVTYEEGISSSIISLVRDEIGKISQIPVHGISTIFPDAPGVITSL